MSVVETDKIDVIGICRKSGECVMTISDHLDWERQDHLKLLQAKLNLYLAFIESGEVLEKYPSAAGKPIRIEVVLKYEPLEDGITFFREASKAIQRAGFSLRWETMAD